MLKLQKFIQENSDWKEKLSNAPYYIDIKKDGDFYLFSYNQLFSDFSILLVRECRGIILDKYFVPVCVPFFKFFNVQEKNADFIDWKSAKVQQKVDGSIMKLWFYNGTWRISTNGVINAFNCELPVTDSNFHNFGELFTSVFPSYLYTALNKGYTYIFELVSIYNKVVITYPETKLYHIGTRDNHTLEELDVEIGIEKPEQYALSSLDECLEATSQMSFNEEGYVVVDVNYNRVKIKSGAYVVAHHLRNNGVVTKSRILDMIRTNEKDEFLAYYPEYRGMFSDMERKINNIIEIMERDWSTIPSYNNRRDLAIWANSTSFPSAMYSMADLKVDSFTTWIFNQSNDRILKMIGE
jgi:hypothetical protein